MVKEEEIRLQAYYNYLNRMRMGLNGDAEMDWLLAEAFLKLKAVEAPFESFGVGKPEAFQKKVVEESPKSNRLTDDLKKSVRHLLSAGFPHRMISKLLQVSTSTVSVIRNTHATKKSPLVAKMVAASLKKGKTYKEISEKFNVSAGFIADIKFNRRGK